MPTEGEVTGGVSPGESIRTVELTTTTAGGTAARNQQVVTIGDPNTAARLANVDAAGSLQVALVERPTYVCNTGPITGATATGTKSLALLWHPAGVTLKYELMGAKVNIIAGAGGAQRVELRRITADGATGTTGTLLGTNPANAASGATVRIAAGTPPTRASGIYDGGDVPVNLNGQYVIGLPGAMWLEEAEPFACRASQAEGWEIVQEVTTTITTAPTFNISFYWAEIA